MRSVISWRIFLILLGLSILSVFAVFPYVVTLQGALLQKVPVPLPVIFLLQLLQSSILFSVIIFLGLYLLRKVRFSHPLLDALTRHKGAKKVLRDIAPISLLLGVLVAGSIYAIDHIFTWGGTAISTTQNPAPVWQRVLAAFYGGITEEILMRLFLMTLFVWLGMKIARRMKPTPGVIIPAIILSAVIFGLGHLPITAALTAITPLIVFRAIVLNGIGGVVFGWLYWKKGLEAGMIAHFTTDIFLLIILPSFIH